jgi:hypothetical protein
MRQCCEITRNVCTRLWKCGERYPAKGVPARVALIGNQAEVQVGVGPLRDNTDHVSQPPKVQCRLGDWVSFEHDKYHPEKTGKNGESR